MRILLLCICLSFLGCKAKPLIDDSNKYHILQICKMSLREGIHRSYFCWRATNRRALIDHLKDMSCITEEKGYVLMLTLKASGEEKTIKYKTLEDIPHSPVYFKDGMWFIYYGNNRGYMSITKE